MFTTRLTRIACGAICAAAVAALATTAAAQSNTSTFVIELNRTGTPGQTTVTMPDPLTGEPTEVRVDTGAFINPCTGDWVNVTGSTTVTIASAVDRFGTVKVDIGVIDRGLGVGWTPNFGRLSGSNYMFYEKQSFIFRIYVGEEFSSDFTHKLSMKGAKSTNDWAARAHMRIKISASGDVQVLLIRLSGDVCRG